MTEKRMRRIIKDLERLSLSELTQINRIVDEMWTIKARERRKKEQ